MAVLGKETEDQNPHLNHGVVSLSKSYSHQLWLACMQNAEVAVLQATMENHTVQVLDEVSLEGMAILVCFKQCHMIIGRCAEVPRFPSELPRVCGTSTLEPQVLQHLYPRPIAEDLSGRIKELKRCYEDIYQPSVLLEA